MTASSEIEEASHPVTDALHCELVGRPEMLMQALAGDDAELFRHRP